MKEELMNLQLNGFTLNESEKAMYGFRNDIIVLVELFYVSLSKEVTHRISTSLDLKHIEKKEEFLNKIQEMEEKYIYVNYAGNISGDTIAIVIDGDKDLAKARLEHIVYELTLLCNNYNVRNKCEICDANDSLEYICVDNDKKIMCTACSSRLTNSISSVRTKRDNVLLGLIGAIVGAFIGSILWILLDQVGFIAGIAGYAIVYCCIKGYDLLGGVITKKGIVICILVSLLMILFADCFSLAIMIYKELGTAYAITFVDALLSVPYFLGETEILKNLLINLGIGYLFAIWASGSYVKALWQAVDNIYVPIKVKKL